MRQVTEDVFTRYFLWTCSITFHDEEIRALFVSAWYPEPALDDDHVAVWHAKHNALLKAYPRFCLPALCILARRLQVNGAPEASR
jgi:hypothetical protein